MEWRCPDCNSLVDSPTCACGRERSRPSRFGSPLQLFFLVGLVTCLVLSAWCESHYYNRGVDWLIAGYQIHQVFQGLGVLTLIVTLLTLVDWRAA